MDTPAGLATREASYRQACGAQEQEMRVSLKSWMDGSRLAVPLSQIKRFGKLDRYGDNRAWTVAETEGGKVWYSLYRDQSPEVCKVMKKRLKGVFASSSRECPEAYVWESDCA